MDAIVKMLEKHQPFFEKISRNVYLQAIKDGFLWVHAHRPHLFDLSVDRHPSGVVGITLPQPLIDWCNKLYNFTMGVMGIMVAGTTAKNFTASMNRRMPAGKVLNDGSTMVAAQCSMLLLAVTQFTTKFNGSELSVFDCTSMGTRGLFSAYIAAFITVWVYKFCVSRDLTISCPRRSRAPSLRTSATSSPLAAPSSSAASSMSSCATSWVFRSPSCSSSCSPRSLPLQKPIWPYPYPGSHRVLLVHRRPRSLDRPAGHRPHPSCQPGREPAGSAGRWSPRPLPHL